MVDSGGGATVSKKVGKIRDVARETNLSIATISRVMNGSKAVSEKTRTRVLEACRKLDYLPNPAARALSTSNTKTIAAIIPTIEHSVFAKFVAAIEQTLSAHGYTLVLAISNSDEEEELAAAQKLLGMGAEAFILSGASHSAELLDLMKRRNVPHVFTSVWDPEAQAPTIGYDNFDLAAEAVRFIAEKGHERIAIVHGPRQDSDRTRRRIEGALSLAGDDIALTFFEVSLDVAGGKQALTRILAHPHQPDAILCFSDVLALGCHFGAQAAGKTIPDDLSLMGFDNLDWSAEVVPQLTTIDLPAKRMGQLAAMTLVAHLDNGDALAATELTGRIIERASVGPPKPQGRFRLP